MAKFMARKNTITEEELMFYAVCIIETLRKMHDLDIAHCDMKLENILLGKDGSLKLPDFGLSVGGNKPLLKKGDLVRVKYPSDASKQELSKFNKKYKGKVFSVKKDQTDPTKVQINQGIFGKVWNRERLIPVNQVMTREDSGTLPKAAY